MKPETTFQVMLNSIGDSLSNLASSDDEEDWETRMMIKMIQSLASWAKMMNLAGWWAQSPKRYSTAWRAFGRSRWGLTNCRNWDWATQRTTSLREIWSTGRLNWRFPLLWSPKQTRQQPHHHRQHLESLCRVLILSPDNQKSRKWRLAREVVKWGWVWRDITQTITSYLSCQKRCPIRHRCRLWCQFNPWTFTPAYSVARELLYSNRIRTVTWSRLLRHRRNW